MSALYILIIASIVVAAGFLVAFIWSVKSNQYEDREGAAMRMLYDNEISKPYTESKFFKPQIDE
ncbi:MAG: cbb3-type cytochrome oxidase assembly protein CcoS [Bacteroidetes bacterium]|nr:cbb3-type cytochrome oxidase assembly protein CcoS [Bacteroidota bacterium]MBS1740199.1 cbb3-type cytochrome oxidase assembly protein CcoS [Bacteroidota bacterium]MBS1776760.1 cbb3-type cytochrome oxidase assembly protein CcoS [Bacteroidota bacterium]